MSTFTLYEIKTEPEDVSVSDERLRVPGIRAHITADGVTYHGTVIPPEGDSITCWVDNRLLGLPRTVLLELGDRAQMGADDQFEVPVWTIDSDEDAS